MQSQFASASHGVHGRADTRYATNIQYNNDAGKTRSGKTGGDRRPIKIEMTRLLLSAAAQTLFSAHITRTDCAAVYIVHRSEIDVFGFA